MVKLPAVIFVLFLLQNIHFGSLWAAGFSEVSVVTLEKGKPIQLPKNYEYTKVQIRGLNGTIYSDSFSQLGVSDLRIQVTDITKIEDGALCSSPTLKTLEVNFYSSNATPTLTKNMFENCNKLEELLLGFALNNGPHHINQNALEDLSSLKGLHFQAYNVTHLKKDFLKIPNTVTTLCFSYCSIQEIDSDTFEDLTNLETIVMIHNDKLRKIPKGLFKNTPKLKTLTLRNNRIQNLKWDEFEGLTNLEELNIAQNRIWCFDADKISTNFPNLKSLYIELNPLPCKEREPFVNQLKTKMKKLVDVEYNFSSGLYDSCEQD
jgi:Leucine-rich repeat (LRR) protein